MEWSSCFLEVLDCIVVISHGLALMRDDNKKLADYRIKEGSKVMMLGQSTRVQVLHPASLGVAANLKQEREREKSQSPVLSTRTSTSSMVTVPEDTAKPEDPVVTRIQTILEKSFRLLRQLEILDQDVEKFNADAQDAEKQWKKMDYSSKYLNENLLRLIIEMDTVDVDGNQNARQVRKSSIQQIQSFLKRLDTISETLKSKQV